MKKLIVMLSLTCLLLSAQELPIPQIPFAPEKYICYFTEEPINVDGTIDEAAWEAVDWTNDFIDIEGPVRPTPRFKTRAKMLWDDEYFYVAAELSEPDIWGTLKNRDDIIFFDNDFEIFIDPDGDTHTYCEFEMNALNTVWDLLLKQPYRDINKASLHGFDIKGLLSGVTIYGTLNQPGDIDSCWTVEVAYPWEPFEEITTTPVPPKENDQWRINFSRVEWKTEVVNNGYKKIINPETNRSYPEDNWVWSPQGVVNMHYPEMWGYVQFTKTNAGAEEVSFVENNIEAAKWYLRMIYYYETNYYQTHGSYTSDIEEFKIPITEVSGFTLPLVVENTTNLFEASIKSEDGSTIVSIKQNGLISITKPKK